VSIWLHIRGFMKSLFHVGLAKAGSTYLQNWWAKHPDVVMYHDLFPIVKRGQWRLEEYPQLAVLSDERFASYFKHEASWEKRLDANFDILEYQRRTRDFLYELNSAADILVITRAPSVKLLKSIYSQYVKTGGSRDFDSFFEDILPALKHCFNYAAIIDLYREKFPSEQIIVLPLEWMMAEEDAFLGFIESRYGLSRYRLPPSKVNTSVSSEEMFAYVSLNRAVTGFFKRTLGRRGYKLYLGYIKLLSSNVLNGFAQFYCKRKQEEFSTFFSRAEEFLEGFRCSVPDESYSPQFEAYRSSYESKSV